ncbi:CCAT-binding transcription factor-like protein, putative [Plasmodium berghei]|uniref:CCAT-binding transcription factor-like protein n=2 Tax=Plasmodium berghei TaxID=5821 RepID=A0A509AEH3_PLABA|nr:conserved Plasmodium protein, unknown function [Plasmodium berghei ANKA]CXI12050.1 CCAT-binding transcription factor-like protein, putative [Plasmodium berghei]SCM15829.1 CCAT-binding transcription factor-like protein, putative [Plasmodium berghei]VUC54605.1 conserved Plasmodium protein, unknown function [Plasmodium berghei ANKA]|eukprot:XP_034420433.1 conserved Plasmodium protein, unknown function [Plasmodium berghei ANKA]
MKNNIMKISFALLFLSSYFSEINGNVTNKNKYRLRSYLTKNEDLNNTSYNGNIHGESEDAISVGDTTQTLKNGESGTQGSSNLPQGKSLQSTDTNHSQDGHTEDSCAECGRGCTEGCEGCHDASCLECHEGCEDCPDCHDESCLDCQTECTDACREECAKIKTDTVHRDGENVQACTQCTTNDPNCEECKKIITTRQPETPNSGIEAEPASVVQNAIEDITNDTKTMPDENEAVCDEQLDEGGDNEEEEDIVDSEDIEIIEHTGDIEDSDDSEELELELELELEEAIDMSRDGQEENEGETGTTTTNEQRNNHNTNTNEVTDNNQTNNSNNTNNNNNGNHFIIKEYKGNHDAKTENENILNNALSDIDDNQFSSDIQDFAQDINEYVLMEEDI